MPVRSLPVNLRGGPPAADHDAPTTSNGPTCPGCGGQLYAYSDGPASAVEFLCLDRAVYVPAAADHAADQDLDDDLLFDLDTVLAPTDPSDLA